MIEAFRLLKSTASANRDRIEIRILKETEGEPTITRRSRVFAAVAREMLIDIYPDDLLVGNTTIRPRCAKITPLDVVSGQTKDTIRE